MLILSADPTPVSNHELIVSNHHFIVILFVLVAVQVLVVLVVTAVAVRMIIATNQALMERFEQLREDSLRNYIDMQKQENARLVADTRAATAKMNVMADALWEGLKDNPRA